MPTPASSPGTAARRHVHVLLGVALLSAGPAAAADMAADMAPLIPTPAGTFLPYLDAPRQTALLATSPKLAISIGGSQMREAIMDTGSTGIVISGSAFTGAAGPGLKKLSHIDYTSSGKRMWGLLANAPATITGADGRSITTASIPFLMALYVTCLPNARDCTQGESVKDVAMIGIGFGRQGEGGSTAFTADRNPFTHVAGLAEAALKQGYIVTTTGVQVGVSAAQVQEFGKPVKLDWNASLKDWDPQPVQIRIADQAAATGTILVDTGVTKMYLSVPYAMSGPYIVTAHTGNGDKRTSHQTLSAGTTIDIAIPGATAASAARYRFGVGTDVPMAPHAVDLVGNLTAAASPRATFVNTSTTFLNGYSILFDNDDGIVSYRQRSIDTMAGLRTD